MIFCHLLYFLNKISKITYFVVLLVALAFKSNIYHIRKINKDIKSECVHLLWDVGNCMRLYGVIERIDVSERKLYFNKKVCLIIII